MLRHVIAQVLVLSGFWVSLSFDFPTLFLSVFFLLHLFLGMLHWRTILSRLFCLKTHSFMTTALALYSHFMTVTSFLAIAIVWYRVTDLLLVGTLIGSSAIGLLFERYLLHKGKNKGKKLEAKELQMHIPRRRLLRMPKVFLPLFVLLLAMSGVILYLSNGQAGILSPWQAISPLYVYGFALTTFLLVLLCFSQYKTRVLLALIVLYSLVLHAYVPLSHDVPWGGDVWRLMSMETRIARGDVIQPVLFGEEVPMIEQWNMQIPAVFLQPHKYVYGQFWASNVLLHRVFDLDLMLLHQWLVPLLWGIMFPILLYQLGRLLFSSPRYGLWLAFLGAFPFSLQAVGSLSIAVSFNLLSFLLALFFWISFLRDQDRRQAVIACLFACFAVFGYPVYSLLLILFIALSLLWSFLLSDLPRWGQRVSKACTVFFFTILFPSIELFTGRSYLPEVIDWMTALKQWIGQWSGWFFAEQIRPHDILSGNIFFNHTPEIAFVPQLFSVWRWPVMLSMLLIAFCCGYAVYRWYREERHPVWATLIAMTLGLMLSYVFGWYVFEGERVFIRRLDPTLALLCCILCVYGIRGFFLDWRVNVSKGVGKMFFVLFACGLSWVLMIQYTSGPDLRVVTPSELHVASYIADYEAIHADDPQHPHFCALADTWILLALEGFTHVAGGGFPLSDQFAQPERVELYDAFYTSSSVAGIISSSRAFFDEDTRCWVVLEREAVNLARFGDISEVLGEPVVDMEGYWLWRN